ncbi:MAG: hypothetical protein KAI99_01635 [Cyclobacteriaceae bacterium]|nr:hypothetical protein [Cyclobacteriaceae bacterium]
MPASHNIDKENKIIFTSWYGEPENNDLVDALNIYLRDIKSSSDLDGFNELLDFSEIKGVNLSINALIELGKIASKFDKPGNNKLAIVVSSPLTYGLARMYGAYRNFNPQSNKKVLAFRSKEEAMVWLKSSDVIENDKESFFSKNKLK